MSVNLLTMYSLSQCILYHNAVSCILSLTDLPWLGGHPGTMKIIETKNNVTRTRSRYSLCKGTIKIRSIMLGGKCSGGLARGYLLPARGEKLESEFLLDRPHDSLGGDQDDSDGNCAKDQQTDTRIVREPLL